MAKCEPNSLHIRRGTVDDIAVLANFNRLLAWETENLELEKPRVEQGVAALIREPTRGFYLVAERAGKPAGALLITYEWSDWRNANFWWIQSVYVAEESRRQGVFRALHQAVLTKAREEGACGIRLYVERENQNAQSTYRHLGLAQSHYLMFEAKLS